MYLILQNPGQTIILFIYTLRRTNKATSQVNFGVPKKCEAIERRLQHNRNIYVDNRIIILNIEKGCRNSGTTDSKISKCRVEALLGIFGCPNLLTSTSIIP